MSIFRSIVILLLVYSTTDGLHIMTTRTSTLFKVPFVQKSFSSSGSLYLKPSDTSFEPFTGTTPDNAVLLQPQKTENDLWTARISLLVASALYGTNFGCVKILDEAMAPSFAAACRFSLAGLVFLPYFFKAVISNNKKPLLLGGLEVGVYCFIAYWAQAKSLLTSSASTAAFICSLAVIVVPILDQLFSSKKGKDSFLVTLLPAILAVFGVAALELGGIEKPGVGDLWACLQPLFFGLGFWRVESHMRKATCEGDPQAFTGAMMATISTLSLFWVAHDFIGFPLQKDGISQALGSIYSQFSNLNDWRVVAAVFWTGVVTTALTQLAENFAMKQLTASESTIIFSTEPLWGTAFAAVALNEPIGWNTAVGAVLIMSACIWSTVGPLTTGGFLSTSLASLGGALEDLSETIMSNLQNWYEY